jgi:beta-lactamase class A
VIPPVDARRKKAGRRRGLPPGQKLLILLGVGGLSCALTLSLWQARPNIAQQLPPANETITAVALAAGVAPAPLAVAALPAASQMPFALKEPATELTQQLTEVANKPKLHAGIFIAEPDTGRYVDIDSHRAYSAASMIKLPVLVSLLRAIDGGQVRFDQMLTIRDDLKGGGSGYLQYRPSNTKISLADTAQLMMTISDNTATNMIIDLLGGKERCNADFAQWGLANTRINDWLPDLAGTNITSPYDLALLLAKVDSGQLLSTGSRSWLFATLEKNKIRTLLPQGIPPGCKIADKTGDIASLVGDAGIITTPTGKRYIAVVAVERPWNDRRANAMIREISKCAYGCITGDVEGVKQLEQQQQRQQVAAAAHPRHHRRRHRHR